jgi:hypothetical protein
LLISSRYHVRIYVRSRSQNATIKGFFNNIGIKGITRIKTVNYGFFIFTSNSSWMIPVGKG